MVTGCSTGVSSNGSSTKSTDLLLSGSSLALGLDFCVLLNLAVENSVFLGADLLVGDDNVGLGSVSSTFSGDFAFSNKDPEATGAGFSISVNSWKRETLSCGGVECSMFSSGAETCGSSSDLKGFSSNGLANGFSSAGYKILEADGVSVHCEALKWSSSIWEKGGRFIYFCFFLVFFLWLHLLSVYFSWQKQKTHQLSIMAKTKRHYSLWNLWVATTAFKLLLATAYHSTDFDVHRNWLAITNTLPMSKWYIENTSQWTLDYPPLFAYFEYVMSLFVPASVASDGCLDIVEKGMYGLPTIYFQRITVIVSEILLFVTMQCFVDLEQTLASFVVASSIVLSPGLLIVDHIHFQYNGFLFAILCGSIIAAKHKHYLVCGFLFAVSICFKHIFLYLAPAFFVFLLRDYCLDFSKFQFKNYKDLFMVVQWRNLIKLGSVVIAVFSFTFGPFAVMGVMPQLLARLFPFSRGLTHAYWAPNVWAVYSFLDKVLIKVLTRFGIFHKIVPGIIPSPEVIVQKLAASDNLGTKGLVQDVFFIVFPNITPELTFILTLFYQILAVVPVLFDPSFKRFIGSLTLCGYASFLFGWHVHEKAIMLVILPFSFLVVEDRRLVIPFLSLVSAGFVSLFPLLYESSEFLIKSLYTLLWCIIFFFSFRSIAKVSTSKRVFLFDRLAIVYIFLLIPMVITVLILDTLRIERNILPQLEFMGLMIYSIYTAIGVIGSWIGLSWLYSFDDSIWN